MSPCPCNRVEVGVHTIGSWSGLCLLSSYDELLFHLQHERVRAIYKYALDRIPKENAKVSTLFVIAA